jgi:hypothetical protein
MDEGSTYSSKTGAEMANDIILKIPGLEEFRFEEVVPRSNDPNKWIRETAG